MYWLGIVAVVIVVFVNVIVVVQGRTPFRTALE